ncbi:hypothetical protein [Desulfosarcina cetonica]|uniref:hypothetical protein n=1 Tax=Desulfosarcina cetonica TaxID=90730 RepID=UPI0006D0986C|nr:hypothetical protein [Desulfosarcina cetonica]
MNRLNRIIRAAGGLAVSVTVLLVLLFAGSVRAGVRIDGISGTNFNFTTGTGEISTPDGGSVHFWGYQARVPPMVPETRSMSPNTPGRP